MSLSPEQIDVLLRPIVASRVKTLDGQSYVPAFDIRAMLNRVFGFANWSLTELAPTELLYESETTTKSGKSAFAVAYRASIRLSVHGADYDGTAVGNATMPDYLRHDAHDTAIKAAESGALKRAAMNLGDQFGLSLYNGGSMSALVRKTWDGSSFITGDSK